MSWTVLGTVGLGADAEASHRRLPALLRGLVFVDRRTSVTKAVFFVVFQRLPS